MQAEVLSYPWNEPIRFLTRFLLSRSSLSGLELNSVILFLITLAIPLALKLGHRSDSPGELVKPGVDSVSTSGVSSLVDEAESSVISIANSSYHADRVVLRSIGLIPCSAYSICFLL